jgi:hypothetical protein
MFMDGDGSFTFMAFFPFTTPLPMHYPTFYRTLSITDEQTRMRYTYSLRLPIIPVLLAIATLLLQQTVFLPPLSVELESYI